MKKEIARESSKPKVSSLPFSAIPQQSKLFLQYLSDPQSLREFYPNAVSSCDELIQYSGQVLAAYTTDRGAVCSALTALNQTLDAGEATFANIELLRGDKTVAVVTGQQAGLFTGPLYTIYKALSAVALARRISASGAPAVPVFWAATEDHDFEEVSHTSFISTDGQLASLKYEPAGRLAGAQVGSVEIDESINLLIERLAQELPETEFSVETRALIEEAWIPGASFGDGFLRMLARVLVKYGIIYLDPTDPSLKSLSIPLFEAAIDAATPMARDLVKRSADLAPRGFQPQVFVDESHFPVFRIDDEGRRQALQLTQAGAFRVKGGRREMTAAELTRELRSEPERFSAGVMFRPVVQDYLLPTVCYLGGGAEIAYFAQNSEVYRILDRPATPIMHRQSFTILEAKHRRLLARFDLELGDLFPGIESVKMRVSDQLNPELPKLFADVEERINTELHRLDGAVSRVDATVAASLATRRRKIIYHLAATRQKALLATVRRDETLDRQLNGLFSSLLPNGGLQERSLGVITFLNKYGPNCIDWVYDAIDLDDRDHRIIEL